MNQNERAVSPVIGVMLMLVVVIIIAAVVSGFSGSMLGGQKKAPMLSVDTHIKNNGYWTGSLFSMQVTGVESAIPTNDLKIVTSWSHVNATSKVRTTGGATVNPSSTNTHIYFSPSGSTTNMDDYKGVAPWGYGLGVGDQSFSAGGGSTKGTSTDKYFGNYSLGVGTVMYAEPFGAGTAPYSGGFTGFSLDIGYGVQKPFIYTTGVSPTECKSGTGCATFNPPWVTSTDPHIDGMMAVLGTNWSVLRAGDTVDVSIIHIPSGKTIYQKDVTVEG